MIIPPLTPTCHLDTLFYNFLVAWLGESSIPLFCDKLLVLGFESFTSASFHDCVVSRPLFAICLAAFHRLNFAGFISRFFFQILF